MSRAYYPGEMTDENIRLIFEGAGDFTARKLECCGFAVYAYSIDGLTSGGSASDYIFKPLSENLTGTRMIELYENALSGRIYNSVAVPCKDLNDIALKLVNGFCVLLFPGPGPLALRSRPAKSEVFPRRRWRIPSRARRMHSRKQSVRIPA